MKEKKNILDYLKAKKVDTPDAIYFENFAQNIIDSQKVKIIPFYKKPLSWVGLVAASFIILLSIISKNSLESPKDVLLALNNINQVDIESYIYENIDDFDTEMIVELIPVVDAVDKTETNSAIEEPDDITENPISALFNDIDKEDILEYFDSEEIELEELEDELYI